MFHAIQNVVVVSGFLSTVHYMFGYARYHIRYSNIYICWHYTTGTYYEVRYGTHQFKIVKYLYPQAIIFKIVSVQ